MFIIVDEPGAGGIVIRRVTVGQRLAARLRCRGLDRDLADGASAEADVGHALRALTLQRPRFRARCAAGIEHALAAATGEPVWPPAPAMPVSRVAVTRATPMLLTVLYRLRAPGPVSTQGLALTHLLLTDGLSPLYLPGTARDLEEYLDRLLAALDPSAGG